MIGQGLQGQVPSHVSVALDATSVVATDAQRAPGSRALACHQESATKALPQIFVSAKHVHAKNSNWEAYNTCAKFKVYMVD